MKKITLLAVAFAAITFASCKKDRVCTCTYTPSTGSTWTTTTTMYKVKKGDAREKCIGQQTVTADASGSNTGTKSTCDLK